MQIRIIFGHTGKKDIEWTIIFGATIEAMKILLGESFGGFDGAISTETIEDKTVAILNKTNWTSWVSLTISTWLSDHKTWEILILQTWVVLSIFFNSLHGRGEILIGLTINHGIPASFDNIPISFVTIGKKKHTTATTSDTIIERKFCLFFELVNFIFEKLDKSVGRLRRNVAAI